MSRDDSVGSWEGRWPWLQSVACANSRRLMDASQAEMLAFMALPKGALAEDLVHQPLERINKEIKRRSRSWGSPQQRRPHPPGRRDPCLYARGDHRRLCGTRNLLQAH